MLKRNQRVQLLEMMRRHMEVQSDLLMDQSSEYVVESCKSVPDHDELQTIQDSCEGIVETLEQDLRIVVRCLNSYDNRELQHMAFLIEDNLENYFGSLELSSGGNTNHMDIVEIVVSTVQFLELYGLIKER